MTWLDDIGIRMPKRKELLVTDTIIDVNKLSIVVPVKNNQAGIDKLLNSFFKNVLSIDKPTNMNIVDNNSDVPISISAEYHIMAIKNNITISVLRCSKPGPAAARNMGWRYAVVNGAEWVLFVDSDCVFTHATIPNYISALDGSIAYQGTISALSEDWLSAWYVNEGILSPRSFKDPHDFNQRPNYIITANVLINKIGLLNTGGFNENFKLAAGEDVWLGYMLSDIGTLAYAPRAVIQHDFLDGNKAVTVKNIYDLIKRFERYGHGNYSINKLRQVPEKVDYWQDAMNSDEYMAYRKYIFAADHNNSIEPLSDGFIHQLTNAALRYGYTLAREQDSKASHAKSLFYKIHSPSLLTGFMLFTLGTAAVAYIGNSISCRPRQ